MRKSHWIVPVATVALSGAIFWVGKFGYQNLVESRPPVSELRISSCGDESQRITAIEEWLDKQFENRRFNGGVLFVRRDDVLISKLCGYTDHTATKLLDEHSAFRLASVSKQFTAAGILRLAELKKLNLDDPVSKHFGKFVSRDVTIRHLLNQTSGISDTYMELASTHRDEFGEVLTVSDVVALVSKYGTVERPPGERMQYSNTNYVLLAGIIEKVSGTTFEEFMLHELFVPLGMNDSRVWNLRSDQRSENQTNDFSQRNSIRRLKKPTWIDGVAGDGAVFCSLHDFVTWNQFWTESSLVSDELRQQATQAALLSNQKRSDYGFGWVIDGQNHWHNGSWLGARTYIARYPETGCCLVVLDNSSNQELSEITDYLRVAVEPLVLDLANPANAPPLVSDGAYEKVSPFTGVRWKNELPEVELDDQWYQLAAVDGIAVEQIIDFATKEFGDKAHKRFGEDFVETLVKMGHSPEWYVNLTVVSNSGNQTDFTVLMSHENRAQVRDAP